MEVKNQLLEMLTTIEEAEDFLRKRCAAGMAGQSLQLFEDLFSLIGLIRQRFQKSEYLPMRTPMFRDQVDALAAVGLLDQVQDWTREVRKRVHRKEMRQQLARGGILGAAVDQGKPFVETAKVLAEMARGGVVKTGDEAAPEAATGAEHRPTASAKPAAGSKRFDATQESVRLARAVGAAREGKAAVDPSSPTPDRKPVSGARRMGAPAEATPDQPEENPAAQAVPELPAPPAAPPRGARPMGAAPEPEESPKAQRPLQTPAPFPAPSPAVNTAGDGRNTIDRAFAQMMDEVSQMNEKQVAGRMIGAFPKLENRYKMVMIDYLRRFPYWGPLDPDRGIYGVFSNRAAQLVQHQRDFLWLYDRLADYRSKKTLLAILDNWFSFNFKELTGVKERVFANYFDFDLIRCDPKEVFVDIGAGTGETAQAFLQSCGGYQKIYCYEISNDNMAGLRESLGEQANVELRQKGISDHAGVSAVAAYGDALTSHLAESGEQQVEIATLDEDLQGAVSFIKINVEGGEAAALQGCGEHIHRSRPKLVIRLDHQNEDLWKIPKMVDRLEPKYRLYLRHYGGNLVPAEYVLFAVQ